MLKSDAELQKALAAREQDAVSGSGGTGRPLVRVMSHYRRPLVKRPNQAHKNTRPYCLPQVLARKMRLMLSLN